MERGHRLLLGVFVLLLVDMIWVASSELSEYIFNDKGFNKPFFSTYLKTSMFSLYLLGFLCWKPWRHQCSYTDDSLYQALDEQSEDDPILENGGTLGEPSYVPLKTPDNEKVSDAESDDTSVKSVRFSKLTEEMDFPLAQETQEDLQTVVLLHSLLGRLMLDFSALSKVLSEKVRQMSDSYAMDAMLSRLSFAASVKTEQLVRDTANKLAIREVVMISFIFGFLWFVGNYCYQLALSATEAGIVNVVSSTCGLFTLLLAAVFPSGHTDHFTLSKLIAVLLMVAGVSVVSLEDINMEGKYIPMGVVWALLGSILYASYMVFIKRKVPSEEKMDFTMFFGFVGLFTFLILWPGFIFLNMLKLEVFQLPNREQVLYMTVNGLIGTVFSELLWLWGCFLTSSLMATLSLSLTIPLTMMVDVWVKGVVYSWLFYVGALPMVLSFVAVTLLTHFENWDPMLSCIKLLFKRCWMRHNQYSMVALDSNEYQSLIVNENTVFEYNDSEDLTHSDHHTNSRIT